MKPIHPKLATLMESLDFISARRMDPVHEGDRPGPSLAAEIESGSIEEFQWGGDQGASLIDPRSGDENLDHGFSLPTFWFPDSVDAEDVVQQLAGANGEEYRRLALLKGVDAYAWYLSFHQRAYQWGIYVPVTGVAAYAVAALSATAIDPVQKLNLALRSILAHERFHFAADIGIAQMELATLHPIWWALRDKPAEAVDLRDLEEELATAAGLRAVRYCREPGASVAFSALVAHSKLLPNGYRDGHELVSRRQAFETRMRTHSVYAYGISFDRLPLDGSEFHHLYPAFRQYELDRCPTHVLLDQARFGLGDLPMFLIASVQELSESQQFMKRLAKLSSSVRAKWGKTRRILGISTGAAGLDFKPWPPGGHDCFSVRVDRGLRAHLRFVPDEQRWIAEAIGTHSEMGHG